MFALAAKNGWKLHQLDTDTAFLHGKLDKEIYMEAPEGVDLGGKVYRLKKCLYGLKQAPLVWYQTLKAKFEREGFVISHADSGLLVLRHPETQAFAVIYVDDQVITGPDEDLNAKLKAIILKEFPGKDLGEARFFLGMKLDRDFVKGTLKLSQTRHIDDLLKVFGQEQAYPLGVPIDNSLDITPTGSPQYTHVQRYMSLVGSLNYIAMCTRPDIAYATSLLCRCMSNPTQNHFKIAIRVLRYLKGTKDYGLVFGNNIAENIGNQMVAYSDSSFAPKEDSIPQYGYAFMFNGATVDWASRKMDKVATSTSDAEFVAAAHTSKEALWMNKLLADLSLPRPVTIFMDNTAALTVVKDIPQKSRSIRVHHHAVVERARNEDVKFEWIHTDKMIADIFTKALPAAKFNAHRDALGVLQ